MKVEIKVPAMGESITEATVGTILKESGSHVKMDEEVLELETEKVNQVLYSPQEGVVQWSVSVDDVVEIGQVIGTVDTEGQAAPEAPKEEKEEQPKPKPEPKPAPAPAQEPAEPHEHARVTREQFTQEVKQGKTPEAPAPQPKPAPAAPQKAAPKPVQEGRETRKRMSKIRRVIAERLVEAQSTTAMLTTFNEIDMSQVMRLRSEYKDEFEKEHGIKLGFMSFFVKAVVSALQQIPDINAYIDGDEIVYRNYYDIGVAVSTDRGLVVPVVRDCDKLTFAQIEESILNYAKQARDGNISVDDLQGGGFTVTNGGVFGSLLSTPILNMPQSGILGMHKIQKRPVVVDDEIVIRPMMYVALSYDHRIVDGKQAVTFLVHLKNILEDPASLILEI